MREKTRLVVMASLAVWFLLELVGVDFAATTVFLLQK
jgi:hypothetical protein